MKKTHGNAYDFLTKNFPRSNFYVVGECEIKMKWHQFDES